MTSTVVPTASVVRLGAARDSMRGSTGMRAAVPAARCVRAQAARVTVSTVVRCPELCQRAFVSRALVPDRRDFVACKISPRPVPRPLYACNYTFAWHPAPGRLRRWPLCPRLPVNDLEGSLWHLPNNAE